VASCCAFVAEDRTTSTRRSRSDTAQLVLDVRRANVPLGPVREDTPMDSHQFASDDVISIAAVAHSKTADFRGQVQFVDRRDALHSPSVHRHGRATRRNSKAEGDEQQLPGTQERSVRSNRGEFGDCGRARTPR
jgi:hypothetical protein